MIEIPDNVPLRRDEYGAIRVGNTRVLLEVLIAAYLRGDSPEDIHRGFPTVALADIYAVIAYYVTHQEAVDEYIRQVGEEGEQIRRKFEVLNPQAAEFNEKVRALLAQKRKKGQM